MPDSALAPAIALPPPPLSLLEGAALFLDFDGTLTPLVHRPDAVSVDDALIDLLARLRDRLDGRLAIVSGRSIATLKELGFGDFQLAGTHGLEFAKSGETVEGPGRLPAIDAVQRAFHAFADERPGLLVERKSISVGLHFRGGPQWGAQADALAERLAAEHGLIVQRGKMMVELRPGGADKGSAVQALMRLPEMNDGVPVFIGDDVTDEEGFIAASELGGAGILVGVPRPTVASFCLEQVAAVRHYLAQGAAQLG